MMEDPVEQLVVDLYMKNKIDKDLFFVLHQLALRSRH